MYTPSTLINGLRDPFVLSSSRNIRLTYRFAQIVLLLLEGDTAVVVGVCGLDCLLCFGRSHDCVWLVGYKPEL